MSEQMKWAQRWSVNEDGEMVMDDHGSWVENAYYEYLKAENARLKAEVERLRASSFVTAVPVEQYEKLKAEVERLRQEVENADRESMSDEYDLNNQTGIINELLTHKEQMQGKIDRLTKAGDFLAFHYISLGRKFFPEDPLPSSIADWKAAKEGKQP